MNNTPYNVSIGERLDGASAHSSARGFEVGLSSKKKKALAFASSLILLPCSAFAQDDGSEDNVFELSPFVVSGEGTIGYRATSTLAGSRIDTDLKDLGAAISVVTSEFLEDTQATNVQELLSNLTSLEVGGPQGNYSSASYGGGSWGAFNTDAYDLNPQSSARVRGLETPNFTRGYFSTSVPIESYNTGTITVSRGANSLLFGLGSAGGVIDAGLSDAIIGSEETEISVSADNNDSFRTTFSLARTLVEDRLAVRIDALSSDLKYQQDPAFEDSERYYGAFNAVLFENEGVGWLGKTSLKGKFEVGEITSNPASPGLPLNSYEPFFNEPGTNYSLITGRPYNLGPGKTYDQVKSNWAPYARFPNLPAVDPESPTGGVKRTRDPGSFQGYGRAWGSPIGLTFANYDGSTSLSLNDPNGVLGDGRIFGGVTSNFGTSGGSGKLVTFDSWGTGGYEARQPNFSLKSITDRNIFDYRNHLLTGDAKLIEREFDTQQVALEQLLFNGKGGFELVYAAEDFERDSRLPFSGNSRWSESLMIGIDVTTHLPNGDKNPNFGRAYMGTHELNMVELIEDRENLRATAFYEHDFKDHTDGKLGEILGSHRFTFLFQEDDYTSETRNRGQYYTSVDDPSQPVAGTWDSTRQGAQQFNTQWWNRPWYQVYLSDVNTDKQMSDVRLNPVRMNFPEVGDVHYFQTIDTSVPIENGNWQDAYTLRQARIAEFYNGGDISRTKVNSKAFAWQSYLFNENIVGLAGWREDSVDNWIRMPGNRRNPGGDINIARHNVLEDAPNLGSSTDGETTFTWSLVGHLPEDIVENLPVSSVSVHFGEGENFSAISARSDIYGEKIANPSGTTKEMGFSLGFAEDRWLLKVNRFETDSVNSNVGGLASGVYSRVIADTINRFYNKYASDPAALPFEQQPHAQMGFDSFEEITQAQIAAIPAATRAAMESRIPIAFDSVTSRWINSDNQILNLTSTQSVSSEGYEIELVGNPTNNWRVMANIAQIEAITSDSVPELKQWIDEIYANWDAAGLTDLPIGVRIDANDPTKFNNSDTIGTWSSGQVANIISAQTKDGNLSQELAEWRINLVNSYDFTEGRFAGFGVGSALRYQSGSATGYRYSLVDGIMTPDVSSPFKGDSDVRGDIWFSYKKRLGDMVDWKIQLNIRNAIGSQDNILIRTNPDGAKAAYRAAPDRVWSLRNTFSF